MRISMPTGQCSEPIRSGRMKARSTRFAAAAMPKRLGEPRRDMPPSTTAVTTRRRLGEPDDIAGIAVYLASDAGRWTTGQSFVVDGGTSISG